MKVLHIDGDPLNNDLRNLLIVEDCEACGGWHEQGIVKPWPCRQIEARSET